MPKNDADTLKELRAAYAEDERAWSDIRDEGSTDVQILTGDLWEAMDPLGVKDRRTNNRPVITLDELSQYTNQSINDLRSNKRGITVSPIGNGATEQTAQFRQGKIRDIEYRSNAQQAYIVMAENAIQRGYGFLRIKAQYASDDSFDQELVIEPVVNPEMLTPDCHAVRADGSDLRRMWVRERLVVDEFRREYPDAEIKDFGQEHMELAGRQWVDGAGVHVAEAWVKEPAGRRTLLLLKPPAATPENPQPGPLKVWKDELSGAISKEQIVKEKHVETFTVTQYLTNGVEILKTTPWPGDALPFVCCYGKIVYVQSHGQTKRKLLSMIRLARDPQMMLAYLATCEAELVGMTPKFPYFFYEGQLTQAGLDLLAKSLSAPVAGIAVKAVLPNMPAAGLLPFPQRQPYEPPIQALEILKESVRRSIQAAIGSTPLPTDAQRQNDKSGIALSKIRDSAQRGAFHYADHYDESIKRTGQLLNDLLPEYYDTARETSIRKPDDSVETVRINDPHAVKDGKPYHLPTNQGDHDVTISVGPATESQREEAAETADAILTTPGLAQEIGPQKYAEIFALAIKMRNLGPLGDQIAEIVSPKQTQNDPRQQLQQLMAENQQLKGVLQQAAMDKKAKVTETQGKYAIAQMQEEAESERAAADREVKLAVAEIAARVDRMALFLEERARLGLRDGQVHDQVHEHVHNAVEQAKDRAHEHIQNRLAHAESLMLNDQAAQDAQDLAATNSDLAQQTDQGGGA